MRVVREIAFVEGVIVLQLKDIHAERQSEWGSR